MFLVMLLVFVWNSLVNNYGYKINWIFNMIVYIFCLLLWKLLIIIKLKIRYLMCVYEKMKVMNYVIIKLK